MSDDDERTASQDISDAFKVAVVLLTVIGYGIPTAVAKLTGADDIIEFTGVLALTVPLSLWVTVTVAIALTSSWPGYAQAVLAIVTLATFTAAGNAIGIGAGMSVGEVWARSRGQTSQFFIGMIREYAMHYGIVTFLSAVVVGVFLGYAWWRVLRAPARRPTA